MKKILFMTALAVGGMACNSGQKATEDVTANQSRQGRGGGPPNVDEIFKKMDKDQDGLLSNLEVEGRLKDKFATIDVNSDGFISKEELENAPKPKRGSRPPRN